MTFWSSYFRNKNMSIWIGEFIAQLFFFFFLSKNTSLNLEKNIQCNLQLQIPVIWSVLQRQNPKCSNGLVHVCAMCMNKLCMALLFIGDRCEERCGKASFLRPTVRVIKDLISDSQTVVIDICFVYPWHRI